MIGFGPVKFGQTSRPEPTMDRLTLTFTCTQDAKASVVPLQSEIAASSVLRHDGDFFFFSFRAPALNVLFVLPEASSVKEVFFADFIQNVRGIRTRLPGPVLLRTTALDKVGGWRCKKKKKKSLIDGAVHHAGLL